MCAQHASPALTCTACVVRLQQARISRLTELLEAIVDAEAESIVALGAGDVGTAREAVEARLDAVDDAVGALDEPWYAAILQSHDVETLH